ncbi:exonuclease V, mitochondrial [[Candida] railenensis]|uniref:Exonuclease V, mitochondrial n=1 Tax=[Candida] railenensis TaxID=45579 RepID=A0A9P0QQY7_9ASCO|nr:exonuclease V, mitochondrial [[Candida] railenensis]
MNRYLFRSYTTAGAVNTKVINLKIPIPNIARATKRSNGSSEKSTSEANELLNRFIIEKSKIESKSGSINQYRKKSIKNEMDENTKRKIHDLVSNFKLTENDRLPLVKPKSVTGSPYYFYTHNNEDKSIVENPRISVTKLLTKSWCELREYYDIYAGSKKRKSTVEIEKGKKHHEVLELEAHPIIDVSTVTQEILRRVSLIQARMSLEEEHALSAEPERLKELQANNEAILKLIDGSEDTNKLAEVWVHDIMEKLYSLFTMSHAREVLVHSYINLDSQGMVTKAETLRKEDILVSGIIDLIELVPTDSNSTEFALYTDIENWIRFETEKEINGLPMIDLEKFLAVVGEYVHGEFKNAYTLKITDVKTRSRKQIPPQLSVVNAAKQQVSCYKDYLDIMSNTSSYRMLLENATRRHCNIDEPIGLKTVIKMLRTSSSYLFEDFKKLANGEPIGFKEYDDFVKEKYLSQHSDKAVYYDLAALLDKSPIESDPDFEYTELVEPLLKRWKIPLTLRYFAARSGQFYSLLSPYLVKPLVTVDYHYGGESFREVKFEFNESTYNQNLLDSISFWNGSRAPQPVDDLSKCNYCDFKGVCSIPNPHLSFSLGKHIKQLTS